MAKQYSFTTRASEGQVVQAFEQVFYTRPGFMARFKPSPFAQMHSNLKWRPSGGPGALRAAEIESGGLTEMQATGKHGTGSIIGTTVGLGIEGVGGQNEVSLWLVSYPTYIGINTVGGIVKKYGRAISRQLEA